MDSPKTDENINQNELDLNHQSGEFDAEIDPLQLLQDELDQWELSEQNLQDATPPPIQEPDVIESASVTTPEPELITIPVESTPSRLISPPPAVVREQPSVPLRSVFPKELLEDIRSQKKSAKPSSSSKNLALSKAQNITKNFLNKFLTTRPPIDTLVEKKIILDPITYQTVPLSEEKVKLLCDYLLGHTKVQGLFRLSAGTSELKSFWDNIFVAGKTDLSSVDPPHIVAAALKLYLRDQPEPLFPFAVYSEITATFKNSSQPTNEMKQILSELPELNRKCLALISNVCKEVARNSDINKMSIENLAICWAPNLISSQKQTSDTLLDIGFVRNATIFIFENSESLFVQAAKEPEKPPVVQIPVIEIPQTPVVVTQAQPKIEVEQSEPVISPRSIVNASVPSIIEVPPPQTNTTASSQNKKPLRQKSGNTNISSLRGKVGFTYDFSFIQPSSKFSRKLVKSKKLPKDEEIRDCFLVQEINQKKKAKRQLCYLLLSTRFIFLLDTQTHNCITQLARRDIQEFVLDDEKGILLVETRNQQDSFYISAGKKFPNSIKSALEKGRVLIKHENLSQRLSKSDAEKKETSASRKINLSHSVTQSLVAGGFSVDDIWNGVVNLKEVVKKHQLIEELDKNDPKKIVEFVMPDLPVFKGSYRKAFYMDVRAPCKKIIEELCEKIFINEPSRFSLATLRSGTLQDNESLSEYGLGTIFNSWELKLIQKENPSMTGTFNVEFSFPNTPEFLGVVKRLVRVDAYDSIENVTISVCKKMRVQSHLFEIAYNGTVPEKNESLMKYGLGITCRTMHLHLQKKFFPLGTNPVEDTKMVYSFLQHEFFDFVWEKVLLARKKKLEAFCKSLLLQLVEDTLYELDKAYTLPARIAALSKKNRKRFYELLRAKDTKSTNTISFIPEPPPPFPGMKIPKTTAISRAPKVEHTEDSSSGFHVELHKAIKTKNTLRHIEVDRSKKNRELSELELKLRKQQALVSNSLMGVMAEELL